MGHWGMEFVVRVALALSVSGLAHAGGTETLPRGIHSPSFRSGVISGLDQTYSSNGRLFRLGDTKSIGFDAATLARVNKEAETLIRALDSFGSQNLGRSIHLGNLLVEAKPQIQYNAPVLAYGVTDRWTVGVGVPIVRYTNRIKLSSSAANLDFYRSQFAGLSAELDRALNVDLVAEARKTLAAKGYKALGDRDQTFVGDVQLVSLYRLRTAPGWSLVHEFALILPTGPRDDADDLMALNAFGRTAIENSLTAGLPIAPSWTLVGSGGLSVPLPDRPQVRVPTDADDTLPDASQKDGVDRVIGPTLSASVDAEWSFSQRWSLSGGLESQWKAADHYGSSAKGRTDLLSEDSAGQAQRVRGSISYSTVKSYLAGGSLLPSMASLSVSDTVAGRNVERQLRTELNLMLFF